VNEQLEEAQAVVDAIKALIDDLPPYRKMAVGLIADSIRSLVLIHGENGLLAMTLIGAELQLQVAEQEWAEHERIQLAEQEAQGA